MNKKELSKSIDRAAGEAARQLAHILTEELQDHPDIQNVTIDEDSLVLELGDDESMMVRVQPLLDRVMGSISAGADIRAAIREQISIGIELRQTAGTEKPEDAVSIALPAENFAEDDERVHRKVGDWMEILAIDLPKAYVFPTDAKIEEWGVSTDEIFAQARKNLSAGWTDDVRVGEGDRACVGLSVGDPLASSRAILFGERSAQIAAQNDIPEPWMLCVPNRETAIIASGTDAFHAKMMAIHCGHQHNLSTHGVYTFPARLFKDGTVSTKLTDLPWMQDVLTQLQAHDS